MNSKNVVDGIVTRQRINSLLKELFRKSIHICSSLVPLVLYYFYWSTIFLLLSALILYSVCEILRLNGINVPLVSKITEIAARKRDENKFVLGPVTLVVGILLACLLLPHFYATMGIFALSFGDGFASLAGRMFGRIQIPFTKGKTIAGSLTCFAAVFIAILLWSKNPVLSLILGAAAMFIEMLPLGDFDNLIIPIAVGSLGLLI